jgi:hypothetical protein
MLAPWVNLNLGFGTDKFSDTKQILLEIIMEMAKSISLPDTEKVAHTYGIFITVIKTSGVIFLQRKSQYC